MQMIDSKTIDLGKGSPAPVLVHGICCAPTDYQWHIDAFSKSHRVIAPTLRGQSNDGLNAAEISILEMATDVAELLYKKAVTN